MRPSVWLGAAGLAAVALVASAGAGGTAAKQRVAIEEQSVSGATSGTFKLVPLAAGPLKADSGTTSLSITARGTRMVSGQRVTTYAVTETLEGKRGSFALRSVTRSTDAGGGYLAGSGPWSVSAGKKAYAGLRGGGRGSGVLTPQKQIVNRYEGYLSLP